MVETIAPVVHGERRSRWWGAVVLHAVGTTLAAAAFGAALGAVGALLGAPWGAVGLGAIAVVAGLYAARELLGLPIPLPDRRRQVPEWWRTFFPAPVSSLLYGLGLGIGFLTYLRHGTLVAVSVGAVAGGDPWLGAALVTPFGVARGLSVLVARGGNSGTRIAAVVDRLERLAQSRTPAIVNGMALVALGAAAAAAAAGPGTAGSSGLAAWALAGVFGWAALTKIMRPDEWRGSLSAYGLGPLERPAAIAVPLAEAGVVALIVGGAPRAAGLVALGLLAVFSAAVVRASARVGPRVPCGCFGRSARREVRLILFRNAGLAAVAVLVAAVPGRSPGFRWPEPAEALPAILVIAGAILGAAMVRELVRSSASGAR
jgi:methylamine utilization protein MauE